MEESPFDSLARGLNKDLSSLLDPKESSLSTRRIRMGAAFGMPEVAFGLAQSSMKSVRQQPFESLSDRLVDKIAIFPLANRVVINRFGAFIPQSIFGAETDIAYKEERSQSGAINITVHPKLSRRDLIELLDNFDSPICRDDPIFDIGREPVTCGMPDASENLDKYLYGGE
jgi:hypothetical protein